MELSALTVLFAQIGAILIASRLIALVTKRLGQPFVIAEVTAGIALGPSLLGWLWPGSSALVFPASSMPALNLLSQVGLVLFMFLVGLELDPRVLRERAYATVAISHTSIVLPFILGAGAAWLMYSTYAPPGVSLTAFVLFFGAAMSVTAFPVLARILGERGLLGSRVGAMAIACAAVDDVSAWCILAVVVAVARSRGIGDALWTCGSAVAFIAAMLYVVRPALRRLGHRFARTNKVSSAVITTTLALLLASSAATELIGIHAVFGAFLLGAVLPRDGGWTRALVDKLETVSVVLLMPLFFAYSGLRTEIGLLEEPAEWLVAGALLLCATLGKFGGTALAARVTGLGWRESGALGILMNTRGLMELVVLNVGLDLGVISPVVFTMLVLVALVTTAATTPVLSIVYPDRELAAEPQFEREPLPAGL